MRQLLLVERESNTTLPVCSSLDTVISSCLNYATKLGCYYEMETWISMHAKQLDKVTRQNAYARLCSKICRAVWLVTTKKATSEDWDQFWGWTA